MSKVKQPSRPVGRPALLQQPLIDLNVDGGNWIIWWLTKNKRIASGKSIDSLEVKVFNKPLLVILEAADSVAWAMQGRKAGTPPPVQAIYDWLGFKSFAKGFDPQSLLGLAFAIRSKIAKKGTNQPKLRSQEITFAINQISKKHLQKLSDNLAQEQLDLLVLQLTRDKRETKES